ADAAHAGIVHQNVDWAGGLDQRRDAPLVRHVEGQDPQPLGGAGELRGLGAAHRRDDVPAARNEQLGNGLAIARRGSGDEGRLGHILSPWFP
ncbi:hypothetical protein QU38_00395, partial [Staphylococcus aureus]